jgi:hypothetical protein
MGPGMRKRTTLGTGIGIAAAGLTLALLGPAASASAATASAVRPADTAGYFTLCSEGGYTSYAEWPGRGGLSTVLVDNGSCITAYLGGTQNEQVDVYEYSNGASIYIASTIYNGLVGETIVTVAGPSFYVA